MEFKPERYFDSKGMPNNATIDPVKFAFGYGRRLAVGHLYDVYHKLISFFSICAGHHYAENTLFLNIARILSLFDISHEKDASGGLVPVYLNASSGVVS